MDEWWGDAPGRRLLESSKGQGRWGENARSDALCPGTIIGAGEEVDEEADEQHDPEDERPRTWKVGGARGKHLGGSQAASSVGPSTPDRTSGVVGAACYGGPSGVRHERQRREQLPDR